MGEPSRELSPVARFSLALAIVLGITGLALAAGTAYLIGRYVEEQTAYDTEEAVASHFGTVFDPAVFTRPLGDQERARQSQFAVFHLSIYQIVKAQFFSLDGTIVLSYDRSELGRRIDPATEPGLAAGLADRTLARRSTVVGDRRFGVSDESAAAMAEHGMVPGTTPSNAVRREQIDSLEMWVPIHVDGRLVGAVATWRDLEEIDGALRRIQLTLASIIAAAAMLLWLVLRGVYVRSSQRIVEQASALKVALGETERAYDSTLQALSNALDVRDTETGGHSQRVVGYMDLIAREIAYPDGDLKTLKRGALLHDVGKIGVPDHILRKPAALNPDEWRAMRRHPEYGAWIIGEIPSLGEVAKLVRHHHERWDGFGYPAGLAGEAIPFGARVFSVADSFDAMTSDRPYRRALTLAEAIEEIVRNRGTQFDPNVVDAFLRIHEEKLAAIADGSRAAETHLHLVSA